MSALGADHNAFSVVIPARDEASVIARALQFVAALSPGEAEVVVVANGCADDTAARASSIPGVQVREVATGGKAGALNVGDSVVSDFPRVYLGADIVVSADTLRRLTEVLVADPAAAVAVPRPLFLTVNRPRLVRQFYAAYEQLPYVHDAMVGSGIYALNAAGRARFGAFPQLTADDLFVQRLFGLHEVRVLSDASFEIQTPRTVRDLVKVRTRVARGNAELAATGAVGTERSSTATLRALLQLAARRPSLLPAVAVYTAVTLVSRAAARRRTQEWHRDSSTR